MHTTSSCLFSSSRRPPYIFIHILVVTTTSSFTFVPCNNLMSSPPEAQSSTARSRAHLRLFKDLQNMKSEPSEGCSAGPALEGNVLRWNATIMGPADSPWENGVYSLELRFTEQYPTKAPNVRFVTKMFHPNIDAEGHVCVDLLGSQWSPVYTVSTILTALRSLLTDPNTSSANNDTAARLYDNDRKEYNKRVRECAERSLG